MNIAQAKEEIKRALQIYFRRDETGMYMCPPSQQRPILLIGPPGIGKTAVMQQIAQECHVGLVAYTMTHHTRQSAIGLPRIVNREYDGEMTPVTEYTLSEIIASVRDCVRRTGLSEGILFLDEINCVSETLTPVMLQLLQNKTFGMHPVPPGWLICGAGNPPEYNRSAKPFDLVTLDRVRTIPIEPDLSCWLDYAASKNIHMSVLSFLQMRPESFYQAQSNAARQVFVTARGWEDLSFLIRSSEELHLPVGESQIRQYLGDEDIAKEFAAYYRLCCTCCSDYDLNRILRGSDVSDVNASSRKEPNRDEANRSEANRSEANRNEAAPSPEMLRNASFEERYLISSLMLGILCHAIEALAAQEDLQKRLADFAKTFRDTGDSDPLSARLEEEEVRLTKRKAAGLLSYEEECRQRVLLHTLRELREESARMHDVRYASQETLLTQKIETLQAECALETNRILSMIDHAFSFASDYSNAENEMLLLVSGLSRNQKAMHFLTEHPSNAFAMWSARLFSNVPDESQTLPAGNGDRRFPWLR